MSYRIAKALDLGLRLLHLGSENSAVSARRTATRSGMAYADHFAHALA